VRRAARTDADHAAVVHALRKMGVHVVDTSRVGGGFPDLVCACKRHGVTFLVEVKDGDKSPSRRTLTPPQQSFHETWPGALFVVESVADVPAVIMGAYAGGGRIGDDRG